MQRQISYIFKAGKLKAEIYSQITKKSRKNREVWVICCNFYLYRYYKLNFIGPDGFQHNDSIEFTVLANRYFVYRFVPNYVDCVDDSIIYDHRDGGRPKLSNILFVDVGHDNFRIHQVQGIFHTHKLEQPILLPIHNLLLETPSTRKVNLLSVSEFLRRIKRQ